MEINGSQPSGNRQSLSLADWKGVGEEGGSFIEGTAQCGPIGATDLGKPEAG